ncbi:ATP-binding cassette domain-containing protein [Pseudotabrizicola sp. L79]|uniref:ATP-binding cassette domain-containing protein n=1 Tax=Pseudotabrizicola sp. L79 TaxID=3118402 RepID=UPI002F934F7D
MVNRLLPLSIEALTIRRGGRVILGPLSTRLEGDGITVLMGPNGSGKTTLLKAMHGLEWPSSGQIRWALPGDAARLAQAFVFQSPTILRRSVLGNIAYPLLLRGQSRAQAHDTASQMAAQVGLANVLDQPGMVLSGGEKQKLALARALILSPEVLFLDEPCANLDGRATRDIEAILTEARARGTRIVMSTHDLGQARRLADDIWFLTAGHLTETTEKTAFFTAPRSPEAQAYLRGDLLT